ncbi:MAG: UDP-3-O-(3-hydroxymyristoyl)glucosamine N-acyltransferase [Rhodobacteraceae bacterium]|nr:UDP-3-O-(3-hydroxymyristoyl)glucosamine N-acyltransferase [Paracoccaceae bacterium]
MSAGVTLAEIAQALGAEVAGDSSLRIIGAREPSAAGPEHLALAGDPKYTEALSRGRARAALLWQGADWQALGLEGAVFSPRPRHAMAGLTAMFAPPCELAPGVDPLARVDPSALLGPDVAVGPFTVIGAGAEIGAGARIHSHVSIGAGAVLGVGALVHPGVRIGRGVRIGARAIIHPNAVIGADGFSFVTPEPGAIEAVRRSFSAGDGARQQAYARIHSLGGVEIGDDVEIGALSAIDRGTVADTSIGSGTKLDNHVQIGHNVRVGRDVLLCAHVAIAGSSTIGDRTVLAGMVGVGDHVDVGADVVAGGATKILANVPAGRAVMGYPAMRMDANIEAYKALRRLPRLARQVADLEKRVPKPRQSD